MLAHTDRSLENRHLCPVDWRDGSVFACHGAVPDSAGDVTVGFDVLKLNARSHPDMDTQ